MEGISGERKLSPYEEKARLRELPGRLMSIEGQINSTQQEIEKNKSLLRGAEEKYKVHVNSRSPLSGGDDRWITIGDGLANTAQKHRDELKRLEAHLDKLVSEQKNLKGEHELLSKKLDTTYSQEEIRVAEEREKTKE